MRTVCHLSCGEWCFLVWTQPVQATAACCAMQLYTHSAVCACSAVTAGVNPHCVFSCHLIWPFLCWSICRSCWTSTGCVHISASSQVHSFIHCIWSFLRLLASSFSQLCACLFVQSSLNLGKDVFHHPFISSNQPFVCFIPPSTHSFIQTILGDCSQICFGHPSIRLISL